MEKTDSPKPSEQQAPDDQSRRGKRPYQPPSVQSSEMGYVLAQICGKAAPTQTSCINLPKTS
jgi:hypothetical protein